MAAQFDIRQMDRGQFDAEIAAASTKWAVPVAWIKAVIAKESSFRPEAAREEPRIKDRSIGLMQLLVRTARGLGYQGPEEGLFDPATNINLGTKLLAQLRARFGENFQRVYSAYNSGRPTAYLTNQYVKKTVERATWFLQEFTRAAAEGAAILIFLLLLAWVWKK